MRHGTARRSLARSSGAAGPATICPSVAVRKLNRLTLVLPQKTLTDRGRVAHQGRHRRVVLFAILKPADNGPVEARSLGHFTNADTATPAIALQGLQRLLDVEVH